jgi:hypothetical protein
MPKRRLGEEEWARKWAWDEDDEDTEDDEWDEDEEEDE